MTRAGDEHATDQVLTDPHHEDESVLVSRAAAGCVESYSDLVRKYETRLFNFLQRRVSSRQDAEDLVQESFIRAWRKLDQFSGEWRFSTWLYTIAGRLAINHYRANRKHDAASLAEDRRAADPDDGPLPQVERAETRSGIWAIAERELSPLQRTALWLRYGEDFAVADIAKILDKAPVTMSVILFRARQKLAEHLKEQDATDQGLGDAGLVETAIGSGVRAAATGEG